MKTYLLPAVTNGKETVMAYKAVQRQKDMRFSFCKKYNQYIIDDRQLLETMAALKLTFSANMTLHLKDAKQAREFAKLMGL